MDFTYSDVSHARSARTSIKEGVASRAAANRVPSACVCERDARYIDVTVQSGR